MTAKAYKLIVIGCSAGGLQALREILPNLKPTFNLPILITMHMSQDNGMAADVVGHHSTLPVLEAAEKEMIKPGTCYLAPANYHLLVEKDMSLSLSADPRVYYCRPSIDVLFRSALSSVRKQLIAVLLTGNNQDGGSACRAILDAGGLTLIQDPATADFPLMPESAISEMGASEVLPLSNIAVRLNELEGASHG